MPEAVAELAGGDQGDGEREQVAVGDPLDVGERGAQVLLDGRVGDRHDRAVEGHHHHADRHGEEGQPGVAAQRVAGAGLLAGRPVGEDGSMGHETRLWQPLTFDKGFHLPVTDRYIRYTGNRRRTSREAKEMAAGMTDTAPTAGPPARPAAAGLRERKKQRTRDALAARRDGAVRRPGLRPHHRRRDRRGRRRLPAHLLPLLRQQGGGRVRHRRTGRGALRRAPSWSARRTSHRWRRCATPSWRPGRTSSEAVLELVPVELHMRIYQVIESTPALLAVRLRRQAQLEQRITEVVAHREGLDRGTIRAPESWSPPSPASCRPRGSTGGSSRTAASRRSAAASSGTSPRSGPACWASGAPESGITPAHRRSSIDITEHFPDIGRRLTAFQT